MKELLGTASNTFYTQAEDGTYTPLHELILIVSEPQFKLDAAGTFVRYRTTDTMRVTIQQQAITAFIKTLTDLMDTASEPKT